MSDLTSFISLLTSCIVIIILSVLISKKGKGQLKTVFLFNLTFMFIWCFSLLMQIKFSNPSNAIYFEYFSALGACFLPLSLLATGIIFARNKIKLKLRHIFFLIIPITSVIVLWTNNYHNLFYISYSTERYGTVYGNYFNIHSFYSYSCIFIGVFYLLFYSIKNSGFFSKQSILIIIGILFPTTINILFTYDIFNLSVYMTPVSFTVALIFFTLAIFKFKFLSIAPIALQNIVDKISDSYIVINDDYKIIDFNKTFITTFHLRPSKLRNASINEIEIISSNLNNIDFKNLNISDNIILSEKEFKEINKFFNIEITPITSKNTKIGTLILFKDVTQHKLDMQEIQSKQDILMEKDRLASLGQLIGGISHNLKTPIMSISGAAEGVLDLIKEYEESIRESTSNNRRSP